MKDYEKPGFDHVREWDPLVQHITPDKPSWWSQRPVDTSWPTIDVVRCSASRPWHLERSGPTLRERFKYPGPMRHILIESVLEEEFSQACIQYGKTSGDFDLIVVIKPQRGQGYAIDYPIRKIVTARWMIKWDDDFTAVADIPLDIAVTLMRKNPVVRQISWNKRRTVPRKPFWSDEWAPWEAQLSMGVHPNDVVAPTETHGKPVTFVKRERLFHLHTGEAICLSCKDKWWQGPALWDMDFARKHWQFFPEHFHNAWPDRVLYKLIDPKWNGPWPVGVPAEAVEEAIGCYLWGKIGDPKMAEHIGHGESIWKGEYLDRLEREGRTILGERGIEKGKRRI